MPPEPLSAWAHLPPAAIWTGAVTALVIGLFLARRWAARRTGFEWLKPRLAGVSPPGTARECSEYWEAPDRAADDRRNKYRREGPPVPVDLVGPDGRTSVRAYVLDRNSSGVRLAVQQPMATNIGVRLMPCQAPPGTPWSRAEVCWCKSEKDHSEIGCRFTDELPWNVLLLFG
jgi:hypothetical protein